MASRLLRGDRVIVHGQQRLLTAVVYFTLRLWGCFFFFAQTRGVVSYLFDISECEVTLCLCALLCGMTSAVKAGSQLPWLQELMQSMSSNNWCARLPQREAMCQFPGRPSARPVLLLMLKSLFNPGNHFKMSKKESTAFLGRVSITTDVYSIPMDVKLKW